MMLAPKETVRVNLSTHEVDILHADYSPKCRKQVARSTAWRLVKMWVKTPEEWRWLEWNRKHECIAVFRHRREVPLQEPMTLQEYLRKHRIGADYE